MAAALQQSPAKPNNKISKIVTISTSKRFNKNTIYRIVQIANSKS